MVVVSQTVRNVLTELTAQWSMTDPPRYRSEYSIATPSRVSTAYYVRNSQERYLPKLPGRSCVTGHREEHLLREFEQVSHIFREGCSVHKSYQKIQKHDNDLGDP